MGDYTRKVKRYFQKTVSDLKDAVKETMTSGIILIRRKVYL